MNWLAAASRLSLGGLAAIGVILFLVTSAAVRLSGLVLDLPMGLMALLAIVGLPFSICLHWFAQLDNRRPGGLGWAWCLAASAVVLVGWNYPFAWPVFAFLLWVWPRGRLKLSNGRTLLLAAVVLICGFGVVWNLNYLMMRHMPLDRWDPELRAIDLKLYSLWYGPGVDLTGLFPLVHNHVILRLLDNAYAILIPEVMLLAFLFSQETGEAAVSKYLRRLFAYYLVGILIYLCFPVNGPCLYFPEQVDLSRSLPNSVTFTNGMLHDFRVAKQGGQLAGFGYFIAVPSLHVLVGIYLQHILRPFRALFRVFLPVNILLCLSTIVLGYHYLLDSVAALAVYLAMNVFFRWREQMPQPAKEPEKAFAAAGSGSR